MHIESNRETDTGGKDLIMQTEGGKKERKKELLKILRKMNLHCTGAFIRTPHAFFLLSLLDTVSYVQAA